jgi:hypothetical protein
VTAAAGGGAGAAACGATCGATFGAAGAASSAQAEPPAADIKIANANVKAVRIGLFSLGLNSCDERLRYSSRV